MINASVRPNGLEPMPPHRAGPRLAGLAATPATDPARHPTTAGTGTTHNWGHIRPTHCHAADRAYVNRSRLVLFLPMTGR
ncbi:hypothetical protein [Kibdelosporangium philippinense]|uniref:hypothetical protein n=1 Tax=Kibdelosporangium philippinense TaxID=211113 RepID=UPI00360BF1B2